MVFGIPGNRKSGGLESSGQRINERKAHAASHDLKYRMQDLPKRRWLHVARDLPGGALTLLRVQHPAERLNHSRLEILATGSSEFPTRCHSC